MKKIKTGIIGGTFNPPTLGHAALAQFILSKTDLDEIWFMPCYEHRLKKNMVSPTHRLNMCCAAFQCLDNVWVSNYEITHTLNGSVYDLLASLSKNKNMQDFDFSFIIGTDNVVIFDKWKNAEELKKMTRFITIPRQGINVPNNITWYKDCPHVFLDEINPIIEVSSTEIRILLDVWWDMELSVDQLKELSTKIDSRVLSYIETNNLYKRNEHELSVGQEGVQRTT